MSEPVFDIRNRVACGEHSEGAMAEPLGQKEIFKDYYSPLSAPGSETSWVHEKSWLSGSLESLGYTRVRKTRRNPYVIRARPPRYAQS